MFNKIFNPKSSLLRVSWLFVLMISLYGCSQKRAAFVPHQGELGINFFSNIDGNRYGGNYPQFSSRKFRYNQNIGSYEAGDISIPNGPTFKISPQSSLTPPPGTPLGIDVTLTMLVEEDDDQNVLIFTFGPSGCQFDPPAEVWINLPDSGKTSPKLYYVADNGNYIEQQPDSIEIQGQRLKLFIDHFSRYALGGG